MSSDSFQLLGMAERGFLPAVLAKRSRFGTPTLGIVLSSLGICSLVTFNFLQVPILALPCCALASHACASLCAPLTVHISALSKFDV